MKKEASASWEVDPAGKWVSKKETLGDGSSRTVVYRPNGRGTQASWWASRVVETSGYRNRSFEMAQPCFENLKEPFSDVMARAQAAIAAEPPAAAAHYPMTAVTIPPALRAATDHRY